jgi:hypothetical protein
MIKPQVTTPSEPLGAIVGRGLLGADHAIQLRLDGVGVLARIASPSRENGAPGMRRMLAGKFQRSPIEFLDRFARDWAVAMRRRRCVSRTIAVGTVPFADQSEQLRRTTWATLCIRRFIRSRE